MIPVSQSADLVNLEGAYSPVAVTAFFENLTKLLDSPRKTGCSVYKQTPEYNFWVFRTTWNTFVDSWKFQVPTFKDLSTGLANYSLLS